MLTVIIPTHNRVALLRRTLDSLAQSRLPKGYGGAIVVENGGRFGAEAAARDAAPQLHVRYVYFEEGNKSAALNSVLEGLTDELLVFFDDDVRVHPEVLEAYATASRKDPGRFYGGPMGVDYEVEPPWWLKRSLPPSAVGLSMDVSVEAKEFPFLGCNWAAYAADIRRCGGFNPHVGPGAGTGATGQESEMQIRLTRAGVRPKLVANAMVWHYVPQDRCSQEWALRRAYRRGLAAGLIAENHGARFFGYPRWLIRKVIQQAARVCLGPLVRDPSRRFRARRNLAFLRGQLQGAQLAAREGGQAARANLSMTPCIEQV